jgi:predicted phosphodiesterase
VRYGVVADVHGNLHALDAALTFLSTQGVDAYLCAGDLVGYGPFPDECVHRVLDLPGRCVAGNHDLILLDRLADDRCIPLAQASLRWTRRVVGKEARTRLSRPPLLATVADVALAHGSVADPQEYVVTTAQALTCLAALPAAAPGARVLIVGHTHRPLAVSRLRGTLLRGGTGAVTVPRDDVTLLNPGAVGQSRSRDARARVVVLDLATRVATFHAVAYDVAGCRRALRERGLPAESCHLAPSRWDDVAGALRTGVGRARDRLRAVPEETHTGG